MTIQENLEKIQRFVSEFNHGNMDRLPAFLSPEFFNYVPRNDEPDAVEIFSGILNDMREASSDLRLSIDGLEDDDGVFRGKLSLWGTHDGRLWGVPATGNHFEATVDLAVKEVDGRFAAAIENLPPLEAQAILRQVELLPPRMDVPPQHPIVHPEILLKVLFTGQVADKPCSHLHLIEVTEPGTAVCEHCLESGDIWPALRMCLVCGFVGCCETSVNKHMKAHYQETGHCIFRSVRMAEGWGWCYEDNAFLTRTRLEEHYP
jgi:hypothetical protein